MAAGSMVVDASQEPSRGRFARLAGDYRLASWVFLRLLGVVFLLAFGSLWLQAHGLIGEQGILPVAGLMERAAELPPVEGVLRLPTLFWLARGDAMLHAVCAAGVVAALLVALGRVQAPALVACWMLYLSLSVVGRVFLSYQWDVLLLEAGLLGAFLAPASLRAPLRRAEPPPGLALVLLWWLVFRVMVSSGIVKLASGDPTWRGLEALQYHYETQPLPTWIGWMVHRAPDWFHTASAGAMFLVELAVPFLIFAPRRLRRLAVEPLVGLQVLIALTGNYGFFNLLTAALCLLLLDDGVWPRWLRTRLPEPVRGDPAEAADREEGVEAGGAAAAGRRFRLRRWPLMPFAALVFVVSTVELVGSTGWRAPWPDPVRAVRWAVAPFRSINGYGLFAVMTTERPELVVEGRRDGGEWRPYRFPWKAGDPERRPRFVAPHQPRLDWQMWFAALSADRGLDPRRNRWLFPFLARLAEGEPAVLGLLEENPFPEAPPDLLRVRIVDYRFTAWETLREEGYWWRLGESKTYVPPLRTEALRRLRQ